MKFTPNQLGSIFTAIVEANEQTLGDDLSPLGSLPVRAFSVAP